LQQFGSSRWGIALACLISLAGCVSTPGPEPVNVGDQSEESLKGTILDELDSQAKAIRSFRAGGTFVLKSPELEEVQLLRQSSVRYRHPGELHVVGRKYSKAVFELTSTPEALLIVLPTEQQYFYSGQGGVVDTLSGAVTVGQIVREMFFPEDWDRLEPGRVRLGETNEDGTLRMTVTNEDGSLRRELLLTSSPWRVVENTLWRDGARLAVTQMSDFTQDGEAVFPRQVRSEFPAERAFMEFQFRALYLNEPADAEDFDVAAQVDETLAKGYLLTEPGAAP